MLDKKVKPSIEEMISYCGEQGEPFHALNHWLSSEYLTASRIVFPYGNTYGWGISHRVKNRLVCNVFAEKNSFTVMSRLTKNQLTHAYHFVDEYGKEAIDKSYPCNDGGWVFYRVTNEAQLQEVIKILVIKLSK
jgi:hypothetical protein